MPIIAAEQSAEIAAPPEVVYGIIADYREGHPSILPPRWFTHLHVEQGGNGAGTMIRLGLRMGGKAREMRAEITEPEPGRMLVEREIDGRGIVTTFTVDPAGPGRARVTIRTTYRAPGIAGFIERLLAPALLKRVYREELAMLHEKASAVRTG